MPRVRAVFHDPAGERYGLPTFWWRAAPTGYATRRQLRAAGLRPAGQPVAAQVLWRGHRGTPPPRPNAARSRRRCAPGGPARPAAAGGRT